jgi:phosphatidate cytidylyltransferase
MPGGNGASGLVLAEPASSGASRWNDLIIRVLSALVLLPVVLVCVWVGGYAYLALVGVGCVLVAYEWVMMCGYRPFDPLVFWMSAVLVVAAVCGGLGAAWIGVLLLAAGAVGTILASQHRRHPRACPGDQSRQSTGVGPRDKPGDDDRGEGWHARLALSFGFPYLGLAAVALPWLRADPVAGLANTLFVLAIVWGSDVGAYLIGRLIGGPKLAPAISPGKTWSGATGGLVSAAVAGLAVAACLSVGYSPLHVMVVAAGLGIVSQAGDLLESALKRRFGVKDSGHIIPGHGGLLDRLDALLVVAPAAALLAFSVGRGVVLWR